MSVKNNLRILDFIYFVLYVLFFFASLTILRPCAANNDGTWMICHWTGKTISSLSLAAAVLGLLNIAVPAETKVGIYSGCMVISIIIALIPGKIAGLCSDFFMRCNMISKPYTIAVGITLAVYALINIPLILQDLLRQE